MNPHDQYVQGQIQALHALVLAIAESTMDRDAFVEAALRHLRVSLDGLSGQATPEPTLRAIEDAMALVEKC